ncbi:MAG TPA: SIMPL domain-containing protein [Gammaproteobacteria bacterium]|jgi:hypothetical protein
MKTALFASLLLLAPLASSADGLPDQAYISVSGRGELNVAPDIAYISITLEKIAPDAKAARADVEARTAKVLAAARKVGIADKDIDAPSISIQPAYGWDRKQPEGTSVQKLVGQQVTRTVTLTLRELDKYGELADGLVQSGVSSAYSIGFDRSDRAALEQKARALAVADAHGRAAGLAQSAGVNLGAVYSITEQDGGFAPRPMRAMALEAASGPSAPEYLSGKIEISAEVSVLYLIGK